jgi:hypothetical protein
MVFSLYTCSNLLQNVLGPHYSRQVSMYMIYLIFFKNLKVQYMIWGAGATSRFSTCKISEVAEKQRLYPRYSFDQT